MKTTVFLGRKKCLGSRSRQTNNRDTTQTQIKIEPTFDNTIQLTPPENEYLNKKHWQLITRLLIQLVLLILAAVSNFLSAIAKVRRTYY